LIPCLPKEAKDATQNGKAKVPKSQRRQTRRVGGCDGLVCHGGYFSRNHGGQLKMGFLADRGRNNCAMVADSSFGDVLVSAQTCNLKIALGTLRGWKDVYHVKMATRVCSGSL
jgi:hypothetical protein